MSRLSSYWKKQKSELKSLLRLPERKFGQRKIHLLRVEIKKLKALLLMIEFHKKEFNRKKFYKPFRNLFSLAGKVRELQIEKGILKKFESNEQFPSFINSLDRKIEIQKKEFFKSRNKKRYLKLKNRLKQLDPMVLKLGKTYPSHYLENLVFNIKSILSPAKLDKTNGHLVRKKLQILKYNLESLQASYKTPEVPLYEDLLKHLGYWHDLVRVDELLNLELGDLKFNSEENLKIQQIRQKISLASDELFQKISLKATDFRDFGLPSKHSI